MKNTLNIEAAVNRKIAKIVQSAEGFAARAEQMAKKSRPWKDRTGDARKFIKGVLLNDKDVILDLFKRDEKGKPVKSGTMTIDGKNSIGFALVHRVEYGKYLETAHKGKYAVIKPTIESLRAEFKKRVDEIW